MAKLKDFQRTRPKEERKLLIFWSLCSVRKRFLQNSKIFKRLNFFGSKSKILLSRMIIEAILNKKKFWILVKQNFIFGRPSNSAENGLRTEQREKLMILWRSVLWKSSSFAINCRTDKKKNSQFFSYPEDPYWLVSVSKIDLTFLHWVLLSLIWHVRSQ